MTVYAVYSPNEEMCEIFETIEAAEDFIKRNTYTRWILVQREVRKR